MRRWLNAILTALVVAFLPACGEKLDPWQPVQARAGAPARLDDGDDFTPRTQLPPIWSALVVYGVFDLSFLAIVVTAAARAREHRRRAEAARVVEHDVRLADGFSVIAGVVEVEPGDPDPPIAVEILQAGVESSFKGKQRHEWREERRRAVVRPFWLRVDRDPPIRILVEPDERVEIRARLGRVALHDRDRRTRFAEVGAGARVRVHGVLRGWDRHESGAVYREGPGAAVLRPPVAGPMVIDAETPGEAESGRARLAARWAVAVAIAFVVAGALATSGYHLLALTGTPLTATADATRIRWEYVHEKTKTRQRIGYLDPYYRVRGHVTLPGGRVVAVEDECSPELFNCLRAGGCTEVPFVVSSITPALAQVGPHPTEGTRPVGLFALLGVAMVLIYLSTSHEDRPWYRQRSIVDRGAGPLPGPAP